MGRRAKLATTLRVYTFNAPDKKTFSKFRRPLKALEQLRGALVWRTGADGQHGMSVEVNVRAETDSWAIFLF